ncbi:MAG: CpaE family protein [Actinomycetota bacterium]
MSLRQDERGLGGVDVPPAPHTGNAVAVVIEIDDPGLHQEVLDFVGRHPGVDVQAAAFDHDQRPVASVRVVCPIFAAHVEPHPRDEGITLMVAPELSVPVLRTAIRAGIRGTFLWPDEREDLLKTLVQSAAAMTKQAPSRGRVVAVAGARGGVGATFVAAHLTAAFAARGDRAALVDADPMHSDLTAALGVLPEHGARTIEDLLPVIEELSPDHLEDVLFRHPGGFSVLLGPDAPNPSIRPGICRGIVALLALAYDPVVVHLSRPGDPSARDVADVADTVALVASLDLLSVYGARRAFESLGLGVSTRSVFLVMNRPGRSPLGSKDVEQVLGMRPTLTIRPDPRVGRAQQRGRLLPPGTRGAARDVKRLAALVAPPLGNVTASGA